MKQAQENNIPHTTKMSRLAEERGYKVKTYKKYRSVGIEINHKYFWYTRCVPSFQSAANVSHAQNKDFAKQIFFENDIPSAKYYLIENQDCLTASIDLHYPVVVKPTSDHGGAGVITNIPNEEKLRDILSSFHVFPILIEENLLGNDYRITCINHTVRAVALRDPANIVGDGVNTIEELARLKNIEKEKLNLDYIQLKQVEIEYLAENNLSIKSIPAVGEKIYLRNNCNMATGGDTINIELSDIHPENIKLFERISQIFNLNLIGLDVMAQNLSEPITIQENAGLIEVNHAPDLLIHLCPIEGKSVNLYNQILDVFEEMSI